MEKKVYSITVSHEDLRRDTTWTSANGYQHRVCDMNDGHLVNTLLWCLKRKDELIKYKLPLIGVNGKSLDTWIEIFTNEMEYRDEEKKTNLLPSDYSGCDATPVDIDE